MGPAHAHAHDAWVSRVLVVCTAWVFSIGCFENEWFGGHWPGPEALGLSINHLELMVLVGALRIFGERLRGQRVTLRTDNQVAAIVFNKGTARDPALAFLAREAYALMLEHSFNARALYLPGENNELADLPSRLKFEEFEKFYRASSRFARFGPAKRIEVDPSFFSDWVATCCELKAEQQQQPSLPPRRARRRRRRG